MSNIAEKTKSNTPRFESAVHSITDWLGSTPAILLILVALIAWLFSRPLFETRQDWQDIAVVPAAVLTFVQIFVLQRSQNKAVMTLQVKLNEVIASQRGASNRLIALENLSEEEIKYLHQHYQSLAVKAKEDEDPFKVHSVEEAAREIEQCQRAKGEGRSAVAREEGSPPA